METDTKKRKLAVILNQLRIDAEIVAINWSKIVDNRYPASLRSQAQLDTPVLPSEYIQGDSVMLILILPLYSLYATCMLPLYSLYLTLFYLYTVYILPVCYLYTTCMLPVYYMCTMCILHVYYVNTTHILLSYCLYDTVSLY